MSEIGEDSTLNRDLPCDGAAVADATEPDPVAPPVPWTDAVSLPLIDGEPVDGAGATTDLVDPATGQPFARVRLAHPDDIERAAEAAARASSLWRGTEFAERGRRLRRLAALIHTEADALSELVAREQGKPRVEALTQEILPALDHLRFIIRHAERYHAGLTVDPRHPFYAHKRAHYLYDAVGVVALITPSSLPFAVPLVQVAAALAMGNSVILKPSERTPLCALRLGELCSEAGFPAGVVNVVPATPGETLQLAAHAKIDKVFVTGGLEAGQTVMAVAGCAPRPVVLCLGGKAPSIVAGDADVPRAARGVVWGALANAGQNCGSIERVYVEERVASQFLDEVVAHVDTLTVGNPLDDGTDVGPLLFPERRDEVHRQVTEAVAGGAKLLRGGTVPTGPGFYYPPTVLLEPPADCRLMRDETLGPVIPITVVESVERAILLANDCEYALTASGWTSSTEKAERMMIALQAGVVTVNDVLYSFGEPASTWSGFRKSGIGQNHGTPGLREMSRQKFVSFDPLPADAPLYAYPYDDEAGALARASLEYLNAGRWGARLSALARLLRVRRFRRRIPVRAFLSNRRRQVR